MLSATNLEEVGTYTPIPSPTLIVPLNVISEPDAGDVLFPANRPIVLSPFWSIVVLIVPVYPGAVYIPIP